MSRFYKTAYSFGDNCESVVNTVFFLVSLSLNILALAQTVFVWYVLHVCMEFHLSKDITVNVSGRHSCISLSMSL